MPTAFLFFLFAVGGCLCLLRCGQKEAATPPAPFHFAARCAKSTMPLIGTIRAKNLEECIVYAQQRSAFALNFVHKEYLQQRDARNFSGPTCLVFDCPELHKDSSMEENSLFDYYSPYANIESTGNVSCIPNIGVFVVDLDPLNYTQAWEECEKGSGYLADVTSEVRTKQLSALLSPLKVKKAFIGLDQLETPEEFTTAQGLPLSCSRFLSWSMWEPKPGRGGCGALTREGTWVAVPCSQRLPFICELRSTGPLRPCAHHYRQKLKTRCIRKFKRMMPGPRRFPKCGVKPATELRGMDREQNSRRRS